MKTPEDDEFERIEAESGWRKRQIALDQKAENARELGLDYKPRGEEHMTYKTIDEWIEHNPNHIGAIPIEVCHQIWGTKGKETSMIEDDDDIQEYKKLWVGLTDDEICKLEGFYDFMTKEDFFDAIRKVETQLKDKNT